jgi:hypothetical protein
MVLGSRSPEEVAAHEAGHVIVAWHLGLRIEGVNLEPGGNSSAAVRLVPGQVDHLDRVDRGLLAASGLAGQLLAGVGWSAADVSLDVAWLGEDSRDRETFDLVAARRVLEGRRSGFDAVMNAINRGLYNGLSFIGGDALHELALEG